MKMSVYTCINIWMSRTSSRWRKREREWCSHWQWIGFLSNPAVSVCSQVSHMQHTTTHCNSLQLTATHCNSLQLTGVFLKCRLSQDHCDPLQLTATHCNSLHLTAIHCNSQQLTATRCNPLEFHSSVASCTRLCLISCVPHTRVCVYVCVGERESECVCVCTRIFMTLEYLSIVPSPKRLSQILTQRSFNPVYVYTHTNTRIFHGVAAIREFAYIRLFGSHQLGCFAKETGVMLGCFAKETGVTLGYFTKETSILLGCFAKETGVLLCCFAKKTGILLGLSGQSRSKSLFFVGSLYSVASYMRLSILSCVTRNCVCVSVCVCVCTYTFRTLFFCWVCSQVRPLYVTIGERGGEACWREPFETRE